MNDRRTDDDRSVARTRQRTATPMARLQARASAVRRRRRSVAASVALVGFAVALAVVRIGPSPAEITTGADPSGSPTGVLTERSVETTTTSPDAPTPSTLVDPPPDLTALSPETTTPTTAPGGAPAGPAPVPGTPTGGGGGPNPRPGTPDAPDTAVPAATSVAPRCAAADLALTVRWEGAVSGRDITTVVFTNTGPDPCSLRGNPYVTTLDGTGQQIGLAADRLCCDPFTVLVAPGGQAHLAIVNPHHAFVGQAGCEVLYDSSTLRISMPDGIGELRVPLSVRRCRNVFDGFRAGALYPGSTWAPGEQNNVPAPPPATPVG
jgi:hypothetical protein